MTFVCEEVRTRKRGIFLLTIKVTAWKAYHCQANIFLSSRQHPNVIFALILFLFEFHRFEVSKDTKTHTAVHNDMGTQSDMSTHTYTQYTYIFMRSLLYVTCTQQSSTHNHIHSAYHSYRHVCTSACSTYTAVPTGVSEDNQSVILHLLTAPRFLPFALLCLKYLDCLTSNAYMNVNEADFSPLTAHTHRKDWAWKSSRMQSDATHLRNQRWEQSPL